EARLGAKLASKLIVDTGFSGAACCLSTANFDALLKNGDLELGEGTDLVETTAGRGQSRRGSVARISFAEFEHRDIVVHEGRADPLSLGLLSRYCVTFDFPNSRMFLKKGARFGEEPLFNLSGFVVLRKAGRIVIHSVDSDWGPRLEKIAPGDCLLEI